MTNAENIVEKSKKLKAAITAVMYFLDEEAKGKSTRTSSWVRVGRETIMRNRMLVQRRGVGGIR